MRARLVVCCCAVMLCDMLLCGAIMYWCAVCDVRFVLNCVLVC